jgi:hypothetical protein
MKSLSFLVAFTLLAGMVGAADGADLSGEHRWAQLPRAQPREAAVAMTACGSRCRARCPDRYSCYPLYGGYRMPYGTPAYWSRYTFSGWTAY